MTSREIFNAYNGHIEKENRTTRTNWERSRWLGAVVANSNPYRKKALKPEDLGRFPWEGVQNHEDELKTLEERRKWRTKR